MANCRGVTILIAYLLVVCFPRTKVEAQTWQSTNNQQNSMYPPGSQIPTDPGDPSYQWPVQKPPSDPSGPIVGKKPHWPSTGNYPPNWEGNQHLQKPIGQNQNPSTYPGTYPPVWQVPGGQHPQNSGGQHGQNPVGQIPGQNPSTHPGKPPVWHVPGEKPNQNIVGPKPGQNPSTYGGVPPHGWSGYDEQNIQIPGGQIPVQTYGEQSPTQNHYTTKGNLAHDQSVKQTTHPGKGQTPINTCDVHSTVRVPCGSPDISADNCEALNCCYNGGMCYFGKMVTVQCTKDGQFIVVVARDATLPSIDLETISLLGDGPRCTAVDSNSAFAIYQFPVTACGTVVAEEPGMIIYENRMTSSYEVAMGPLGAITRDSSFDLLFQARYRATSVETLLVEVLQISDPPLSVSASGPINVQMRLGNGQCLSKGCNEEEVAYNSYYMSTDYPVTRVLRDPVYVEVQLMDRSDANLVLNLGRCWTTTSPNPHSLPQWDLLIDGCPNRDDRYRSSLVPVGSNSGLDFPSHYRRFIFQMFTFVDPSSLEPQKEQIYIHCSTSVCNAGSGFSCEPNCFSRRRREAKDAVQKQAEPKIVVSSGPVEMVSPTV
ncbi:zona pellucida sperm-binding protein 4-like [Corythoichthys intestinalis]|uniref:zona pellucida sperm-binding protein 4-like n=1 Tax=Corythoichthys intestinalis TaxID=161448 RepID=UPI0025A68BE5|nr:zona pellucida sperm-binding protein 4-like [Corythoichthys intestinalis]